MTVRVPRVLSQRERNRSVLARQLLLERSTQPIPRVLEQMAGLQAQYAPSMYVGLWSRIIGFQRRHLTDALHHRVVVQGTLLRGTIHLVSARDYWPFTMAVRTDRRAWWARVQNPRPEPDEMQRIADQLAKEIGDGSMRRADLADVVGPGNVNGISMWLDLVRVPPSGTWERRRADLFGVAERWLGPPTATSVEGLTHLVRSYLRAFGPATRKDVAQYCGLPVTRIQPALDRLRLRRFRSESGDELFDVVGAPLPAADTPAPVRLLPTWDSTLLGHCRSSGILPEHYRPTIFHTKNPQSTPVFLVDGVVAGTWRHDGQRVRVEPFEPLTRSARRDVESEAERLTAFHS
jgi:winged helix DNA-binding protein